jgi:subtilisin family serine protease
MSTRTTWRWSSLLVVVTMIVSMAAATVSASPAPARPETATAAPAQQPPPPEAKKAPESVHPARPQPPAVSPEEALRKIHPDLRDLAQKASPPLPDQVGTLAGPSSEPIIIEVVAEEGADLSAYFVGGKAIVRPPLSKGEKKTQIFIGFAYPYTLMKIASLAQVEAIIPIVLERTAEPEPYPPDQPRELPKKGPEDWAQLRANAAKLREGWLSWDQAKAFGDGRPDIRPADWFEVMPEGPHQAQDAWARGYTGEGVTVAVLDDGIDPAHPDLMGTQKIYSSTVRPQYNGWPYVFSPFSMLLYAFDSFFGTTYIANGYAGVHYVDTRTTPTLYPCGRASPASSTRRSLTTACPVLSTPMSSPTP